MKAFIDCGYFRGRGISLFKKTKEYSEDFKFYAFEPFEECRTEGVEFHKVAAWNKDGKLTMYRSGRRKGQANGIYSNPRASREIKEEVECIDLSKWIKETFSKDDFVILKMDVEGAEKEILKKMIEDDALSLIDIIYLENHVQLNGDEEYSEIFEHVKNKEGLEYRNAIEWVWKSYR